MANLHQAVLRPLNDRMMFVLKFQSSLVIGIKPCHQGYFNCLKIEYLNLFNHAYFVAITVFPPIAFWFNTTFTGVPKGKRCQLENQI
jgi:hypothetical protein